MLQHIRAVSQQKDVHCSNVAYAPNKRTNEQAHTHTRVRARKRTHTCCTRCKHTVFMHHQARYRFFTTTDCVYATIQYYLHTRAMPLNAASLYVVMLVYAKQTVTCLDVIIGCATVSRICGTRHHIDMTFTCTTQNSDIQISTFGDDLLFKLKENLLSIKIEMIICCRTKVGGGNMSTASRNGSRRNLLQHT